MFRFCDELMEVKQLLIVGRNDLLTSHSSFHQGHKTFLFWRNAGC